MKALILAAGQGTRIKPFDKTILSLLGKPLISYHVEEFLRNKLDDLVIVCNKYNHKKIRSFLAGYDAKISYVIQREIKGTTNAIFTARRQLEKDDYFIVKYSDSMLSDDVTKIILSKFNKEKNDGMLTLIRAKNIQASVITNNNRVKAIYENKPARNGLSNIGLFILSSSKLFSSKPRFEEERFPAEYILINKGSLGFYIFNKKKVDIGRPSNIIEANRLLIKRFGTKILSSRISEHALLGDDIYVGETAVIKAGAVIKNFSSVEGSIGSNSCIDNTIVMEKSRIGKNSWLKNSVISSSCKLGDNFISVTNGSYGCFIGNKVVIDDNIIAYSNKIIYPNTNVNKNIDHTNKLKMLQKRNLWVSV